MKLKNWVTYAFFFHRSYIFYKLYRLFMLYTVQYKYIYKLCSEILSLIKISTGNISINHTHPYFYHVIFPEFFSVGESYVFKLYMIILNNEKIFFHTLIIHYSRGQKTKMMEDWARTRMVRNRRHAASSQDRILIQQSSLKEWGKGKALNKTKIVKAINGDKIQPKPGNGNHAKCMRQFLSRVEHAALQNPGLTSWNQFIPENSPLVDYLVVATGAQLSSRNSSKRELRHATSFENMKPER